MNTFIITSNTSVGFIGELTLPIQNALNILCRDLENTVGARSSVRYNDPSCDILLQLEAGAMPDEQFSVTFTPSGMRLKASDELGMIYGILHISGAYLGVKPFWFWADQPPKRCDRIAVPSVDYLSPPSRVRYRGWFINDEVCLKAMCPAHQITAELWRAIYEALLRLGGNLTIVETPLQTKIAEEMGLYITWHHINPFGAKYFSEVYPDLTPSYTQYPKLYEALWQEALDRNGKLKKVVWILAFRGQGDCPFWDFEPQADTPEKRAAILNQALRHQYEMLQQSHPGAPCAIYLYGETADLYARGLLEPPAQAIKIWSDNGYGKMVSRRQDNVNPRVPALPALSETGLHGLYHHVTFHDLQASNHLTMFPNTAQFMADELQACLSHRVDSLWVINCGNIRPHLYFLDLVARLWRSGTVGIPEHLRDFALCYHGTEDSEVLRCYSDYANATIPYGSHEDEKAGEEFYHHITRFIVTGWLSGAAKTYGRLFWLTGDVPFPAQVQHVYDLCHGRDVLWEQLELQAQETLTHIPADHRQYWQDSFLLQTRMHLHGCRGLIHTCQAFFAWQREDFILSYRRASQAIEDFRALLPLMEQSAQGKWHGFYSLDVLTGTPSTLYCLDALRRYLRIVGDGPDLFWWRRNYLAPPEERALYPLVEKQTVMEDDEFYREISNN